MLENNLIEQCSPTLASLKCASLFSYHYKDIVQLIQCVEEWNRDFSGKDVRLFLLKATKEYALIYVYRSGMLRKELAKKGVADFLSRYGYTDCSVETALSRLALRIRHNDVFPHEIGLFLGYPLDDVEAFIENKGENCLCVGCWKVYYHQCEAQETFARFNKCRDLYRKLWHSGCYSIAQLTVAA